MQKQNGDFIFLVTNNWYASKNSTMDTKSEHNEILSPQRGLPPWHGGGAYAPMTRTAFQSEGEELTKRRPPDRNNHTTRHQSQVAGDLFGFTADHCDLLLTSGLRIGRTDMASALGRCNNLPPRR